MVLTHLVFFSFFNGAGGSVAPSVDTHDDAEAARRHTEATRRRDEEYRRARNEMRAQLLAAVERVTGKPPPLDQSLKQLATIARRSEGFDYPQALRDIAEIEGKLAAEAISGAAVLEERNRIEQENENAIRVLLMLANL